MGKHRKWATAGLITGCTALWAAGFWAPAFRQVPRETRGDILFVALFASLVTAMWLMFGPLLRRVVEIEDGIEGIHKRVLRIKGPRAVAPPRSGAS